MGGSLKYSTLVTVTSSSQSLLTGDEQCLCTVTSQCVTMTAMVEVLIALAFTVSLMIIVAVIARFIDEQEK